MLRVIGSSRGELETVFTAILENATRLCGARFGALHLCENGALGKATTYNAPRRFLQEIQQRQTPFHPHPKSGLGRAIATKRVVEISDYAQSSAYKQRDPAAVRLVDLAGARTLLVTPILKEGDLVGTIAIYRQEVEPFTNKQIELVKNFAAQAVIAIENARLLSELRRRTANLTESLEQQTATSQVLSVISRSAGDLETFFRSMLENAVGFCQAKFGFMLRYDGTLIKRWPNSATCPHTSKK